MPQQTAFAQQRRGGRASTSYGPLSGARNMTPYVGSNLICAAMLFTLTGIILFKSRSTSIKQRSRSRFNNQHDSLAPGSVLQRGLDGIDEDVLWQVPSSSDNIHPRAILFLAHGCSHRATDWWPPDNSDEDSENSVCPDCIGLPEECAIVKTALEKNIVVVAMSAQSSHGCWSQNDGPSVAKALTQLQKKFQESSKSLSTIPILAFGASSGGHFVSHYLPEALEPIPIDGWISQISASTTLPPVLPKKGAAFLAMARDNKTKENSLEAKQTLETKHHIPVFYQTLKSLPLMPDFFSERINGISLHLSTQLVQTLKNEKFLDDDGFLLNDPNRSNWRESIKPLLDEQDTYHDTLVPDQSPLSEVLKVAWSAHELSRDGVEEALNFLLSPPLIDS